MIRFAWLLVLLAGVGCNTGGPVVGTAPPSYQNLKIISVVYLEATRSLNRPPERLEELTPFLKKRGDPAVLLRSPDDGQDYKIVWGVDPATRTESGRYPVVAYEQNGSNGKRYVLVGHHVMQVTNDELRKLPFPPGHKRPV
jgi:hypothetical protein